MSSVTLKNAVKRFGSVMAVDNLSSRFRPGIRRFGGLVWMRKNHGFAHDRRCRNRDSGEIYIGDTRVNELSPRIVMSPWSFRTMRFTRT